MKSNGEGRKRDCTTKRSRKRNVMGEEEGKKRSRRRGKQGEVEAKRGEGKKIKRRQGARRGRVCGKKIK